jgi:multidrug resistance efflux pump
MKPDPNRLPAIPTPVSAVWREFRIQVVPFVVFAVVVGATVFVWKTLPLSSDIRGVGEGMRSLVTSPRIGVLQRVEVQPYQWVEAGDPLVTILPFDPGAQLSLLQSELQLTRLRLEPSIADQQALNYEQIRVDWLKLKNELATAKIRLQQSENAIPRNEDLFKEGLISKDIYEGIVRDRDVYKAEVREKTASIEQIEARMAQLRPIGESPSPGTNQFSASVIADLDQRMAKVQTNWNAITLVAPISGRVHMLARRESEYVREGEPLVMIASPRSDRIVAYMRQPLSFEPQPGMAVDVQTQNRQRQRFTTTIAEVGAQLVAITNGLAYMQQGALVDMGLPIILAVPANIQLRPGETVNVALHSRPSIFGRNQPDAAETSKPVARIQ